MKTLLITGISGFLGRYLAEIPPAGWELVGWRHRQPAHWPGINTVAVDLTDPERLSNPLRQHPPDAIIHLAAASSPNFCEENPTLTHSINVEAPFQLARYCAERGLPFIFTSTDLVFGGDRAPYTEADEPAPVSVYGRQKSEAERRVLAAHPGATVARLPLLYGRGANFLPAWIERLRQRKMVHAFTDEYRTPAYAEDVARGLLRLLTKGATGIWHLGGPERMSRYEMGVQVARHLGVSNQWVRPVLRSEAPMPAPRPADVSLHSQKVRSIGFHPKKLTAYLRASVE